MKTGKPMKRRVFPGRCRRCSKTITLGRRILAGLVALLARVWAAVPAYAASPAVDIAYLTREPWQNVPVSEFRADGAMGYYQIYADTDIHCLYFAVSMQDQQEEPGANTAAVARNLHVSSAKFSTRKFTFTTGADKALVYGFAPAVCIMMGFFTAVGGGMLRDGFMGVVPGIFQRTNFYAIAAIAGSASYVCLVMSGLVSNVVALVVCVVVTMGLRWLSLSFDIKSPTEDDIARFLHRKK